MRWDPGNKLGLNIMIFKNTDNIADMDNIKPVNKQIIFTIGHSNLDMEAFDLIREKVNGLLGL